MKLLDENGNVYLDYGYITSKYNITRNAMHRLLTSNLTGLAYRNKKVYLESEVRELFASNDIKNN